MRARLPHGAWELWLDREVPFTRRSARSYIEVWEWSRDHPVFYQRLSMLGPSKLYVLAKLDTALVQRLSPRSVYVVPSSGKSRSVEQMNSIEFMEVVGQLSGKGALPEPSDELPVRSHGVAGRIELLLRRTLCGQAWVRILEDRDESGGPSEGDGVCAGADLEGKLFVTLHASTEVRCRL